MSNISNNQREVLTVKDSVSGVPFGVKGVSADGSVNVNITSGSSAGIQYAELATTSPGTGTLGLGRYKASAPTLTDGQLYGLQLDSSGNLKVTGSLSVGGTTDNSAYTAGSSTGTPAMGFYHSILDAVTDGRAATVAITAKRAMMVNLQNASGTEIGTSTTPLQVSLANTAANATAVKVDGSAVTQPVSATSLPLPTGAATSAKQPALGVAGTASTDVITVQGIASMTALKVDGSAVTQPVSGTITANAGTNLNTSLLALESGGNLASIKTDVDNLNLAQASTTLGQKGNLVLGAVTTAAPTYTTAQSNPLSLTTGGALRVDASAATVTVSGTVTTTPPSNASTNIAQINAVTPLMGNGLTGTGSLRVTIASDNTAFAVNSTLSAETTKVIGVVRNSDGAGNLWTSNSTTYTAKFAQDSNLLGTLGTAFTTAGKVDIKGADGDVFVRNATAANLKMDISGSAANTTAGLLSVKFDQTTVGTTNAVSLAQIGATTVASGNGVVGAGVQRVAIASDNTAFSVNAVESGTWNVGLSKTGTGWSVSSQTALTTTATVSAAAGKFGGGMFINLNSAPAYIQVFDTTGAVTLGTTVPTFVIPIPANSTAANGVGFVLPMEVGIAIANGIKVAATTTATGLTTVSTGLTGFVFYA